MEKDQFGLTPRFYAVLAFALALLGKELLCGLVLAFVLVTHNDQWLTRQVLQAFFLSLCTAVIAAVVSGITRAIGWIPVLGPAVAGILGAIPAILGIVLFICGILGLLNVAKGQEANIPICRGLAEKAVGLVKTVTYSQS